MEDNNYFQKARKAHLSKEERLPKCFKDVEKVIRTVKSCQSNFKTVLANSRHRGSHFKKIYSMTLNVLQHYNYIQEIINKIHLLEKEKFLKQELATILIYEMLFGKGYLPGESKIVTIFRNYEDKILNAHKILQSSNADKLAVKAINVPRYARVNTLVTTVPYVIKDLENLGFQQCHYNRDTSEEKYLDLVKCLKLGYFLIDFHFKDVLVFEHTEKLIHLEMYCNGHIFLQDKASYIPVHVLNPKPGCAVLDACAAPGMKTVHIAAKMKNKGILIACERDKGRFESLKNMIQYGSVKISKVFCKDFKLLDPNDQAYSTIEYILLDPSCSGSGMVNRMDEVTDTETSKNKERLTKLSGFQIILLKHALRFPSVQRVVYSTCSINQEENEYVVHEVLQQCQGVFNLVPAMPEWSERGYDDFEFGKLCLRTVPEKHLTNGFFVAVFERVEGGKFKKDKYFLKNKKIDASQKDDVDSDFESQEKIVPQWERSSDEKRMEKTSDNSLFENGDNYDCSFDLTKKKKFKSEQNFYQFKNYNSMPSKIFEKEDRANCLASEHNNSADNTEEGLVKKEDFIHESITSKEKRETTENLYYIEKNPNSTILNEIHKNNRDHCSKNMSEMFKTNVSSTIENVNCNYVETFDNNSLPNKKSKKYETETTCEAVPFNSEGTLENDSLLVKRKKYKSKKHKITSQIVPHNSEETFEDDSVPVKNKKHKSQKHEIEISSDNVPHNSEETFEDDSVPVKRKKHKSKKHEIEVTSDIVPYNSEETFEDDSVPVKRKKQKSKKHEIERTSVLVPLNSEETFGDDSVPVKRKKHKSKKHEIEVTSDIVPYNSEETFEDDSVPVKMKKHKSKKHEIEITSDIVPLNSEATFEGDSVLVKRKMHKSKKHEIEIISDIVPYNSEETLEDDSVPVKRKKHKSKKHEIEITSDIVPHNSEETFENYFVPVKRKKHKRKKHEIEGTSDIVSHNSEETFENDSVPVKRNKHKSKKHKNEETNDIFPQNSGETFTCNYSK